MYHSAANPLIRVALFPILLLFWQYVFGTDLPLLAPAMCAVFLTTTHEPPPFIMVLLMGGILFVTAWLQAVMSGLLIDYPQVYYLFLFGVFYWCMERTKNNAQDVFAILLIVSTAMIAVFTQQKGISVEQIPMALLKNIFIAGFTAYLAYFLFPKGEPLAETVEGPSSDIKYLFDWQTMIKSLIIMFVLVCAIQLNLEQSTIITVIVALIIKDPDPSIGKDYGLRRLLTTYASVLYAVPPLVMSLLQVNIIGTLGAALVSALFMGIHAVEKKASLNSIQLLYTSYVVLVFYGLTSTSISALADDLVRFSSVFAAVLIGIMSLIVLYPKAKKQP
ncbi:multidrug transporter [Photobacterium leiognathi subsp. mandapamensis]|nr:multidrug transporter [Photobacterium leiognathi subsp. mandapamensis]